VYTLNRTSSQFAIHVHYTIKHNTSYAQRSRKFVTTFELLKSFEVDSSRHAPAKSSQVKSNVIKSMVVVTWSHC